MSNSWKGGSTRRWRAIRAAVLARDGGMCRVQIPGEWKTRDGTPTRCAIVADCVHHTLGKGATGDDPDYCVASCTPCNLHIGDPTETPDPPHTVSTQW